MKRIIIAFAHEGDNKTRVSEKVEKPPYAGLTEQGEKHVAELWETLHKMYFEGLGKVACFAPFWSPAADNAYAFLQPINESVIHFGTFTGPHEYKDRLTAFSKEADTVLCFLKLENKRNTETVLSFYQNALMAFGMGAGRLCQIFNAPDRQEVAAFIIDLENRTVYKVPFSSNRITAMK